MAECGGLENRCTERYRGFESYPLRIFQLDRGFEKSSAPTNGRKSAEIARQRSDWPTRSELPKERAEGAESYPLRVFRRMQALFFLIFMFSEAYFGSPLLAKENQKQAVKPSAISVPAIEDEQKHRKEVLDDIYSNFDRLEPQEIEKAAGLRRVVEGGHLKYYLADRLLEDLPIKVLELLDLKLIQTVKQADLEEVHETEERRKALEDMMDARRLASEESNRWKK